MKVVNLYYVSDFCSYYDMRTTFYGNLLWWSCGLSNARNKIWLLSLRLVKLQSRIIHGAKIHHYDYFSDVGVETVVENMNS